MTMSTLIRIKHKNVLLFISDAPSMVKAEKALNIFYSKLIHLNLVHGFNLVAKTIRAEYLIVDTFIVN